MKTILLAVIYGTLVSGNFVRAPYAVKVGDETKIVEAMPEAEANSVGYKMMVDERPPTDTNHYAVAVGWTEDTRIRRAYEIREVPPPPSRRLYKYDISVAAMEHGEITNLVAFISADVGVKWMWDAAEIIVESDPYFIAATNEVISSGVVDAAKVRAILDRAYELGQLPEAAK